MEEDYDPNDKLSNDLIRKKAEFVRKLHPSRHKDFNFSNIQLCLSELASQQGEIVLNNFNSYLDPLHMYYMDVDMLESKIRGEDGILNVIEECCRAFDNFSNWKDYRDFFLPSDWKERRKEIESSNVNRIDLFEYLNKRISDYCLRNYDKIFEWQRKEAFERWNKVKKYFKFRNIYFYWLEISQRKHYQESGVKRKHDIIVFEKSMSEYGLIA